MGARDKTAVAVRLPTEPHWSKNYPRSLHKGRIIFHNHMSFLPMSL